MCTLACHSAVGWREGSLVATAAVSQVWSRRVGGSVMCVAFSPDTERIVSGDDIAVTIWHAATGAKVSSFEECVESDEGLGLFCGGVTHTLLWWFGAKVGWQVYPLTRHGLKIPGPD